MTQKNFFFVFFKISIFRCEWNLKQRRRKFSRASRRWRLSRKMLFPHLTCAAISAFSKCPYFHWSCVLWHRRIFTSFAGKLSEFLRKFRQNFWLIQVWVALTLIGRRFAAKPRINQANIAKKSRRGWKMKEEREEEKLPCHEWWKIGGKVHRSFPSFSLAQIRRVVPFVSRDVNLINFLISQISSSKFFCVISRVDGCAREWKRLCRFHVFLPFFSRSKRSTREWHILIRHFRKFQRENFVFSKHFEF